MTRMKFPQEAKFPGGKPPGPGLGNFHNPNIGHVIVGLGQHNIGDHSHIALLQTALWRSHSNRYPLLAHISDAVSIPLCDDQTFDLGLGQSGLYDLFQIIRSIICVTALTVGKGLLEQRHSAVTSLLSGQADCGEIVSDMVG